MKPVSVVTVMMIGALRPVILVAHRIVEPSTRALAFHFLRLIPFMAVSIILRLVIFATRQPWIFIVGRLVMPARLENH
jgi:hypothetical protein